MPHLLTPNQPSQSKFVTEFWSDTPTNIAMKLFVTLSTLLAVSLAEDAKVVAAPLPYYAGYPYAGLPVVKTA